jgi:hypothetical protein
VPGDALAEPGELGDAVSSDPDVVGQAYALCAPGECRDAGESVVLGSVAVANYRTGKDPSSPHMAVWTLGDGKVVSCRSAFDTAPFIAATRSP